MLTASQKHNLRLSLNIAISDFRNRHARSALGMLWLLLTPLGMLAVYWLVFGYLLNISWVGPEGNSAGFVLPFFIGYSIFIFFSDVITSSLNLFVSKSNYVKKSPFPLWVLWLSNFIRIALQTSVYLFIIVLLAIVEGYISLFGLVLFGFLMLCSLVFVAAISFTLSVLGPFVNDLSEAARVILRALFYVSPITYPLAIVPDNYRDFFWFNPLTHIIVPMRNALIFESTPDMVLFSMFMFISVLLFMAAYWFFDRAREAIVDVV